MEDAALKLGGVVASRATTYWLRRRRDRAVREASLAELAEEELASPLQVRKLHNLVDRIGNQVAEALDDVVRARSASLPDNEAHAALLAVTDVLAEADLSDQGILELDADPEKLAARLRARFPSKPSTAGLSEAAWPLYELALDQACRHLVQVVRHLPSFQPRALAEVLSRLSAQAEQLDELLARVPRTSLLGPTGVDRDAEFGEEYLRFVATSLDRLELLGLPTENQPTLPLTVAYLSLSVSTDRGERSTGHRRLEFDWFDHLTPSTATEGVPVEAAIGSTRRTLLRGDAGSGKTTLLNWLAVTAARHGFTDALREWNGCVPFVVRLRSLDPGALPKPEQFAAHTAKPVAGLMPEGWAHRVLARGQGLLLVDGVDEVPAARRREVREWLRELLDAFPDLRVVVTARTAAADRRWLADEQFTAVTLEAMNPANVLAFVQRWHEAAEVAGTSADVEEAQRRLRRQLERPHLRELAATPLLCAMLCALNLAHRSELPSNRMDLYAKALSMLLHLRDAERGIAGLLTDSEKRVVLRDLAWRLTLANRVEFTRETARSHLRHKLPAMPNVTADAEALLTHLLERSGVLRQPVPGKVDFVHRTFQEYLAADEAVQHHHVDTLVAHAHLDTWSETVVMACGHATAHQARELLTGLLDRADEEPRQARRLRLLAAACLETVRDVDPVVRQRVESVIERHLVPPKSIRETGSLASVGHRVLRHLPRDLGELTEAQAAATVRTAALTGVSEAIPLLARYAQDPRREVQRQLAEAWLYFDPQRYAEEVLAEAPLNAGKITVRSLRLLRHVQLLRNLESLWVQLPQHEAIDSFHAFHGLPHLRTVEVDNVTQSEVDLTPLAEHRELEILFARGQHFSNVRALTRLPELRSVRLTSDVPWEEIEPFGELRGLSFLKLDALQEVATLSPLENLEALRVLGIQSYKLDTLSRSGTLPGVSSMMAWEPHEAWGLPELQTLMPNARTLNLGCSTGESLDLSFLDPTGVRDLIIQRCELADLRPLHRFEALEQLYLNRLDGPVDLRPLTQMRITLRLSRGGQYLGLDELGPGVKVRYF